MAAKVIKKTLIAPPLQLINNIFINLGQFSAIAPFRQTPRLRITACQLVIKTLSISLSITVQNYFINFNKKHLTNQNQFGL